MCTKHSQLTSVLCAQAERPPEARQCLTATVSCIQMPCILQRAVSQSMLTVSIRCGCTTRRAVAVRVHLCTGVADDNTPGLLAAPVRPH